MHTMKTSINRNYCSKSKPLKILQYGEGKFLRGYIDLIFDLANKQGVFNGNIAVIKPRSGSIEESLSTDVNYNVFIRGIKNGETIFQKYRVDSLSAIYSPYTDYQKYIALAECDDLQYVISNTTESGIVYSSKDSLYDLPPESYPAKLTQFLYHRFIYYNGDLQKGLIILPVELISHNGDKLFACVKKCITDWNLPDDFAKWLTCSCSFINTLVDSIVTDYDDDSKLSVAKEPFGLWVIETPPTTVPTPFHELHSISTEMIFTDNIDFFSKRKVRILNGAHTSFALFSYLCGYKTVKEAVNDPSIRSYIERIIFNEIIPSFALDDQDTCNYAATVIERFTNPFVNHSLLSISLNSVAKWKERCMPSLIDYYKYYSQIPLALTFSLASLLQFYRTVSEANDVESVKMFFVANENVTNRQLIINFLKRLDFVGDELSSIPGIIDVTEKMLSNIDNKGVLEALKEVFQNE